ncbi:MAG TPA: PilN domain-containing protein [Pontiellaceae bacterium]|nr:PilN domain-containing protein [Pontiellaceae bacterium]
MNFKKMPEMKWIAGNSRLLLAFQDSTVDAVWLEQSLLGPSVRMMERFPRDEQLPGRLVQRLQAAGKTPARVTVCLPRSMVMQRTLAYPLAVQDDLAQMVQFEASRHVPLPEADRRIAFAAAPLPGGKQLGVNLLAARTSEISALIDPLVAAGLPVDEVTGLSSLLVPADPRLAVLLILTDDTQLELALFAGGLLQDRLLLNRQAAGFGKETLVDAVRRMTVRHHALLGAEGIGRVVCGGVSALPDEFQHSLEATFGLHIHALEVPPALQSALPPGAPLLAAALAAAVSEFAPSLNLIERSGRKVSLSRRTLIVAGLCALLAIELLAGGLLRTFAPAVALKAAEREAAELKRRTAPIQAVKSSNRALRSELEQLTDLGKTRVSLMQMLKVLSDTLPEDTYLESISYTRGDDIKLKGRSKTPDRLPQLIQSLPFVKTLEASDIGEKNDDYFGFTISAALRSVRDE